MSNNDLSNNVAVVTGGADAISHIMARYVSAVRKEQLKFRPQRPTSRHDPALQPPKLLSNCHAPKFSAN